MSPAVDLTDLVSRIRTGCSSAHLPLPSAGPLQPSSSTSATPAVTPQSTSSASDVEPDDNYVSTGTSYERASAIISTSRIALDHKLGVFTVVGTQEPRVVRLFPTTTCSCPAQANCYHVLAARMAIGNTDVPKKRALNLTQLRKNVRKRPDKTSGRKRPRLQDVDVVAAGDVDDATTSAVVAAVTDQPTTSTDDATTSAVVAAVTDQPTTSTDPAAVQSSQPAANADYRCPECGMVDPPDNPRKTILWIECELCLYWYHQCCVGVKKGRKHWKCPRCP